MNILAYKLRNDRQHIIFVQMSHLFNTAPYYEFSMSYLGPLKKQLQNRIQAAMQTVGDDLHNIQIQQQASIDHTTFFLYNQGDQLSLPSKLILGDSNIFIQIFGSAQVLQYFTEEEKQGLMKLMPKNEEKNIGKLEDIFSLKTLNEKTPIQNFQRQLKKGYFTISREKQDQIIQQLSQVKLKDIYVDVYNTVRQRLYQKKQTAQRFIFKNEQSQLQSLEDLQERAELSDNSQATESQQQNNYEQYDDYPNQILMKYDFSKQKNQQDLLTVGQDRTDKKTAALKNVITVKPRNSQWVDNFRKQQFLRYSNPTKPWIYTCEDGHKVTVAPVAKKLSVLTGKPRFHAMLKNQRPACVTILTLARDAAARLPNGVGTRADICQLVKQSQYINQDLPEEKLSSTMSGALDRLHYMPDACVKYDSEKKLWIYLHIDRNHEHPGWGDDGQQYTEKNSAKKKKGTY